MSAYRKRKPVDPDPDPGAGEESPAPATADGNASAGDPSPAGGEASPAPAPAGEAEALEQDLEELMAKARERDEYLSLAQRTQADFENYRKRAAKDMAAAESRGVAKLARELLPALDNLQLAVAAIEAADRSDDPASAPAGERQVAEGIRLVQAELTAALARLGVEPYSPEGEPFDPNQHEAMAKQPVEGADSGTVVEVYQPGYRANGSVLRPARVVVAE